LSRSTQESGNPKNRKNSHEILPESGTNNESNQKYLHAKNINNPQVKRHVTPFKELTYKSEREK